MGANGVRERRRHGRAKIHLEAVLERTPPEESVRLTILDFSVGGFFCRTSHPIDPGTWLGVRFDFPPYAEHPPRQLEASAVVVRCEPPKSGGQGYQLAAAFLELAEATKEHIQGYVDWYQLVYGGTGPV